MPAAIVREAEVKGTAATALTDHVDPSNMEFVINSIKKFIKEMEQYLPIKVFCGVEISYIKPEIIPEYCKKARNMGAQIIVVHGESPVEPVYAGTNHAAVSEKGLVDILAHPGMITEEDMQLASQNGVFLELSARSGHKNGNSHIAKNGRRFGARFLVNTDAHSEKDLITQQEAYKIAKDSGLPENEILWAIRDNPLELIKRVS